MKDRTKPVYGPDDLPGFDPAVELGSPGQSPFTRGIQADMYRGRLWTMRQYAGFGTASESNERYRYLLSQGQTGLSVAFDLPTQMGRDSDDPLAAGEVGRVGVAIDSIEDMEALFREIPLERVSTSMTINATASILLAMYVVVAERRGVGGDALRGTVQNDILKEYVARGTYIYPPRESLRITTDLFAWASDAVPKWNVISVSGYHMREAGCTAAQEIAFTLGDAIAYVEAAVRAGLDVDRFGAQLSFFFNVHSDFVEEVAKFRAARRLYDRIMSERFGARSPKARMLRFHTQTAGATLTAQQPLVNAVRVALQAFAAVCGGTQSLHTNSYDEALSLPTAQAATLALRTQQVIAHESGVVDFVDPLGGSYAVEVETRRLEKEATEYLGRIDELGGMVAAIEKGWVQQQIEAASYAYQLEIERRERIVVGVNDFLGEDGSTPTRLKVDPAREREQIERLRALRARRDATRTAAALAAVRDTAASSACLMPPIVDAVRAGATVGEISQELREVFGEHHASGDTHPISKSTRSQLF
ncbi:MAG: methylmalonyl-CoA mutase [Deltaproteobacteria bacterium]|nr:methylmalonyl-CoA mutase [Deltaproteobacteria bacterium]